nr:hypothetical protein [Amycolatopsis cihanbeyliensis]
MRHPLPRVVGVDAQDLPRQHGHIAVTLPCGGGAAVQFGQDRQFPGRETSPLLFDLVQRGQEFLLAHAGGVNTESPGHEARIPRASTTRSTTIE